MTLMLAAGCASAPVLPAGEHDRRTLAALEEDSHQLWHSGRLDELGAIMHNDFRFIAMNGAVETKGFVLGTGDEPRVPSPLRVAALRVETQEVVLHGNVATVIARMHIEATVGGNPLPREMRVLSVFTRQRPGAEWKLLARSITPILVPGTVGPPAVPPGPHSSQHP